MELIGIKKSGKTYISKTNFPSRDWHRGYRFNGNDPQVSNGSAEWIQIDGALKTVEHIREAHKKTTGYTLKPEFPQTELTPAEVDAEFFAWNGDGYNHPDIRGLYDPVFAEIPETATTVEFTITIVDEDCEPTKSKYPAVTEFPFRLEARPVSWYKYPCYIKGDDLYAVIRAFIKSHLTPQCKITSDYDFSLTVERILPVIHEEIQTYDVGRGKRTKIEKRALRDMKKTVINVCTSNRSYGQVVERVNADNYLDLEKKIDAILKTYAEAMAGESVVCPSCRGYGIVDKPKASKIA